MNYNSAIAKGNLSKLRMKLLELYKILRSGDYEYFIWKIINAISIEGLHYGSFYFARCKNFSSRVRKLPDTVKIVEKQFGYEELKKLNNDIEINWKTVEFQIGNDFADTCIIEIQKNQKCIGMAILKKTNILKSRSGYNYYLGRGRYGAWIINTYIAPEYRIKGYFLNLIEKAWEVSKRYGDGGIYGEIHYRNKSSLMAHKRIGFNVIKNVTYLTVCGKSYYFERSVE
jgi:hypothetical protein